MGWCLKTVSAKEIKLLLIQLKCKSKKDDNFYEYFM